MIWSVNRLPRQSCPAGLLDESHGLQVKIAQWHSMIRSLQELKLMGGVLALLSRGPLRETSCEQRWRAHYRREPSFNQTKRFDETVSSVPHLHITDNTCHDLDFIPCLTHAQVISLVPHAARQFT